MTINMNIFLRAALLSLAACLPVRVSASCGHSAGVDFCGPELISLLYITGSGLVYVKPTSPLMPAPAGFTCAPVSDGYLVLDPKASNFKQIYATLLSARISGAPVTLVADPALPTCTILYITL